MKLPGNLGLKTKQFLCSSGIHEFKIIGFVDVDAFGLASNDHQHIALAKCEHCDEYKIDPFGAGIIGDGESYVGLIKTPPPVRVERRKKEVPGFMPERRKQAWAYGKKKAA